VACVLDIVIPVYNEERDLEGCLRRLHHYLASEVPYTARITVADNGSTDGTLAVAREMALELGDVNVIHLDEKGRGGALYTAWMASDADVVAYMDVDLSTELSALMPLVAPLISVHSVAIVETAINDLKGCWRVGRALASGALPVRELQRSLGREPLVPGVPPGMVGQLVRFGMVGVASTLAYALLYLVLHPAMGAQAANLTALLLTAVGNTAANRAFTFGIRGRRGAARHQLHGLLVFGFGLAITSGSLFVLHRFDPTVGKEMELSVLVAANLVATVVRFVALRWVFDYPATTRGPRPSTSDIAASIR
jgi:putative flippase GtrA